MQAPPETLALLQRLRSKRRTEQMQAAAALARLAQGWREEQCDALAAAGAVRPLVQLLRSSSAVVQEKALLALSPLAARSLAACAQLVSEGGILALVPLLEGSREDQTRIHAAGTLANAACENEANAESIVAAGALPALIRMCSSRDGGSSGGGGSGGTRDEVVAAATHAISNACLTARVCEAVVAAGGVEAFTCVLSRTECGGSSGSSGGGSGGGSAHLSQARVNVASAIEALALYPSCQAAMLAAGLPAMLVRLLQKGGLDREGMGMLQAIYALVSNCPAAAGAIADAGGVAALAAQLGAAVGSGSSGGGASASDDGVRACALAAPTLCRLESSPEWCSAVVASGCIPHLVQLLGGGMGEEAHMAAAHALAAITGSCTAAEAAAVAAAGAVPALLAALGAAGGRAAGVDCACIALGNLAVDGHVSAAEADAGAPLLHRLCDSAEQEVVRFRAQTALRSMADCRARQAPAPAAGAASTAAAAAAAVPAGQQQQQQQRCPPRVCAAPGCGATAGLRRCGGCGAVRYCGAACSKAHWRAHKAECRRLQAERAAVAHSGGRVETQQAVPIMMDVLGME